MKCYMAIISVGILISLTDNVRGEEATVLDNGSQTDREIAQVAATVESPDVVPVNEPKITEGRFGLGYPGMGMPNGYPQGFGTSGATAISTAGVQTSGFQPGYPYQGNPYMYGGYPGGYPQMGYLYPGMSYPYSFYQQPYMANQGYYQSGFNSLYGRNAAPPPV